MKSVHKAVEYTVDGHRECRVCGTAVTGRGPTLRHEGETVTVVPPEPADVRSFVAAIDTGSSALSTLPESASDADRVRAVVQALYQRGLLRRRRAPGAAPPPEPVETAPWHEVPDRYARA